MQAGLSLNYAFTTKLSYNSDFEKFLVSAEMVSAEEAPQVLDQMVEMGEDLLSDNLNKFTLGFVLGAEYKFTCGALKNFFVDARYGCSLTNAMKTTLDLNATNPGATYNMPASDGLTPFLRFSNVQVGIGYRF